MRKERTLFDTDSICTSKSASFDSDVMWYYIFRLIMIGKYYWYINESV